MKDWFIKYWLQVLFAGITTFFITAYKTLRRKYLKSKALEETKYKQMQEDINHLKDGSKGLLRDRIIQIYDKYIDREFIPIYAFENVTKLYEEYHALGGNGAITQLVDELRELPKKEKENKKGA